MVPLSIVALLLLSAGFSGLTLGLLSLDVYELKRKANLGDKRARTVYPLRKKGNQLLVTLILGNVFVNAVLTVVLDSVTSGIVAVFAATGLIVIFGEITPQAILGRHGLRVGAKVAPIIERLMWVFSPIAKPLSMLLDKTLGEELPSFMSKDELVKIIEEHSLSKESDIRSDELRIVEHALSFGDQTIGEHMTPKTVVVAVEEKEKLSINLINKLHESGHSRFPVYRDNLDHVVGTLYLRDLLTKGKEHTTVSDVAERDVYYVNEDDKLDHALNAFLKTKRHLFIAVNEFGQTVGVITIEDVIEQIVGREIVDEFDQYDDLRIVAERKAKKNNSKQNLT